MRISTGIRYSSPFDTSDFNDAGICGLSGLGEEVDSGVQVDFFGEGPGAIAVDPGIAPPGLTASDWAKILQAGAATGVQIYRATQSPSLIPGTSLVQNPGQVPLQSAYSVNTQAAGSTLMSVAPIAILGIGVVLVLVLMKGK